MSTLCTFARQQLLSLAFIHAGRESYYSNLAKEDYYTKEQEYQGVFLGSGAKEAGIYGQAISDRDTTLSSLFKGEDLKTGKGRKGAYSTRTYYYLENPATKTTVKQANGRAVNITKYEAAQIKSGDSQSYSPKLVALLQEHQIDNPARWLKERKSRSVVGIDCVFSAPKDVSVLWSQAPTKRDADTILHAHEKAVREALKYLETRAYIRTGRNGITQEKALPICAKFTHTTSRDLDPQLHTHLVVINTATSRTGKTGALDGKKFLQARYVAGMIYQNALRKELEEHLRVRTFDKPFSKERGVSFGIEGITPSTLTSFSKRAREIASQVKDWMTPKQKRAEVLKTRQVKQANFASVALKREWKARGKEQGFNWYKVVNQKQQSPKLESKLLYKEVVNRLAKNWQHSRTIKDSTIAGAVLSASRGRLTTEVALEAARHVRSEYVTKIATGKDGKAVYRLNEKAEKLKDYQTTKEWVQSTLQALQKWQFNNRITFLYATGKISAKRYKQIKEGTHLPKSELGIRVYQALGFMSTKQANYLVNQIERKRQAEAKQNSVQHQRPQERQQQEWLER